MGRGESWSEDAAGLPVIAFGVIDSTNTEAMRRAAAGERGPLWLRAEQQSSGKGRSGRQWKSPPGNMSATLLFVPDCPPECLAHLSLITGVAVLDAARNCFEEHARPAPEGLRLKWPNDVMIGDAKLAGVLIETSVVGGVTVAAVGCGLNITVTPPVGPRAVTRLADHGIAPSAADLLKSLSRTMQNWLGVWDHGRNFAAIRKAWLERAGPHGVPMTVNTGDGQIAGLFAGLDTDGALLLEDPAGNVRRFHYGDISFAAFDRIQPDRTE
jgi:BirA family transcriptional regulator, biotin operon repressor / biotin---[acetyl-CoA-carboxylase] ligase